MAPDIRVAQLNVYPVKACRGLSLSCATIAPGGTGFLYDRHWCIADAETGKFLTQRQLPSLALVVPSLPEGVLAGADPRSAPGAALALAAPGMPELRVPLEPGRQRRLVPCSVWEWSGTALDEGPEPAQWLSTYLGRPCKLLRYAGVPDGSTPAAPDPTRREIDPEWAPGGGETAFADGYPFLLASKASLADLNRHLGSEAVPMDRFRPNIVVAGAGLPAWDEDTWQSVGVGGGGGSGERAVTFSLVKPCDRCKVPRIDQQTARVSDSQPTDALHALRSGGVLGWAGVAAWKHAVFFAWNATTADSGTLHVGDAVEVLARRAGPPAKPPPAA